MRNIFKFLVISFLMVLSSCTVVYSQQIPDTVSQDEKLYHLGRMWSEIKYNFVNMDQVDFDIDSLYRAYIPKIKNTKNDYEFYQRLKAFAASFNDGHTTVWDHAAFYEMRDYFKMNLININKKVYIYRMSKYPEIDSTWLGAEVIKISGIPTEKYLRDSIFPYVSASTEKSLWMKGVHDIHQDFEWKPFKATLIKTSGDTVSIELKRNGEATRKPDEEYWGKQPDFSNEQVEFNYLRDSIGYLEVKSFHPKRDIIKKIEEKLPEIYKANALIIDLRKNGGGSTRDARYLQSLLTKEDYFLNYGWQTRVNDGVKKANANWKSKYKDYGKNQALRYSSPDTITVADSIRTIEVPVVILTGEYTYSAAEDFLVNLYEVPDRPVLIGRETGGSTGSPLVVPNLPYDGIIRICTRRICFPYSGKPFVNQGIKPDIKVEKSIEDLINNKDAVLDTAVQYLLEKEL